MIKKYLFLYLFLFGSNKGWALSPQITEPADPLSGDWIADRYEYQGTQRKILHTLLHFRFEEGFAFLDWRERGHEEFCERKAHYRFRPPTLWQRVIWTNPKNDISCSHDPDMQLGRITENKVSFKDGEFYLHLTLGNEDMTYIFRHGP